MAADPDAGEIMVMDVVYNGDPVQGEKELAPLRAIGTPIVDGVTVQDYMVLQTVNDVAFGHGIRSYAKNGMVKNGHRASSMSWSMLTTRDCSWPTMLLAVP